MPGVFNCHGDCIPFISTAHFEEEREVYQEPSKAEGYVQAECVNGYALALLAHFLDLENDGISELGGTPNLLPSMKELKRNDSQYRDKHYTVQIAVKEVTELMDPNEHGVICCRRMPDCHHCQSDRYVSQRLMEKVLTEGARPSGITFEDDWYLSH